MHPEFMQFVAEERTRQFDRDARRAVLAAEARLGPLEAADEHAIAIRLCRVGDHVALSRLAELEGRTLPRGSFVIGELDGVVVAALPLDEDVPALADPFRRTEQLVSLLVLRAAQLRRSERRRLPWPRRRTAAA